MLWSILGRMREARDEVCEEAEVVHSLRIVERWAMQELGGWGSVDIGGGGGGGRTRATGLLASTRRPSCSALLGCRRRCEDVQI